MSETTLHFRLYGVLAIVLGVVLATIVGSPIPLAMLPIGVGLLWVSSMFRPINVKACPHCLAHNIPEAFTCNNCGRSF